MIRNYNGGLGVACGGIPDSLIATERWIVTHSWSTVLRIPSEALLNLEVSGGGPRNVIVSYPDPRAECGNETGNGLSPRGK